MRGPVVGTSLTTALVALAAVVVLVVAGGAWQVLQSRESLRSLVLQANGTATRIAAEVVAADLEGNLSLIEGFARRPSLIEAVAAGDWEAAGLHLQDLRRVKPELGSAALLDADGLLWARDPADPGVVGKSFAFRDYFRGALGEDRPYLSEVFQQQGIPKATVVALSAGIRDGRGRVIGVLQATIPVSRFQLHEGSVEIPHEGSLSVFDHMGHAVIGPAASVEETFLGHPIVSRALRGSSGVAEAEAPGQVGRRFVAYAPVRGVGWAVVVEQPTAVAYQPLRALTVRLAVLGALVAAVTFFGALLAGRALRRLYRQERLRADDLEAANRALEEDEAQLEAIRVVSEAVSGSLDLHRVLQTALRRSLEVTGLESGALFLVDEGSGHLVLAAQRNLPPEARGAVARLAPGASEIGTVPGAGGARLIVEPLMAMGDGDAATPSFLAAPLRLEGRPLGVLLLGGGRERRPSEKDLPLVEALSRPIAGAVGNARLYEDLRRAQEAQRSLLTRLVTAQEEERRRIASDVHDDSVQVMTAALIRLELLSRRLSDPKALEQVARLEGDIRQCVQRLRQLIFELVPPSLSRDGLATSLRQYLSQVLGSTGIEFEVTSRLHEEPSMEARTILYRIAQEALTNVRRHARASRLAVELEGEAEGVLVRIQDDGVGFSIREHLPRPGHLGMINMTERSEVAGGWCRVRSAPGAGTTVEFWIPRDVAVRRPAPAEPLTGTG